MPSINDRIGSQNVIRVLSNASAPPTRLVNLSDIDSARKSEDGLVLVWDSLAQQFIITDKIDASSLIQTVIGGIGLGQALKKTDPMQMPELSSAFEERLRQSEDLARQGFSPAEEAKVRQDINKAYKIGIDNLVRGTAGDRAKFLAGTGVLDAQRSSALL